MIDFAEIAPFAFIITFSAINAIIIVQTQKRIRVMPAPKKLSGICKMISRHIGLYASGDLPDETEAKFKRHIRQCPTCKELLREVRAQKRR